MKKILIITALIMAGTTAYSSKKPGEEPMLQENKTIHLPQPVFDSETSLEQALLNRRSVREFSNEALNLKEVSQLLWAAQGITEKQRDFRTAPSAGALYPLELYVVIGNVKNAEKGVYKYKPDEHALRKVKNEDVRSELSAAALGQNWVEEAAMVIVLAAVYERTTQKYGDRGIRYVHMEEGHASQNIYLQSASLNLGTVAVGAFHDQRVNKILNMQEKEVPLCIMPVGKE